MQIHEYNFYRPKNILGQSKLFWKSPKRQKSVVKIQVWSGKSKIFGQDQFILVLVQNLSFFFSRKDLIQLYVECIELDKEDKQYT